MQKLSIDDLAHTLQPHYSRFNVANRLLFTGHSHQAWPDVAEHGMMEAFDAAATDIDDKWDLAFKKTEVLRNHLRYIYDDPQGMYSLAPNTHDLLIRLLSALNWKNGHIITTDSEFHTVRRQTTRLEELGVRVTRIPAEPSSSFTEQLRRHLQNPATIVILSRVFFNSSLILQDLPEIAAICRRAETPLLIDDYHGTNVVPLSLQNADLEDVFLVTGGYKYLQWGEGNCFLRYPAHCELRPAVTGWFADFQGLSAQKQSAVRYDTGNNRFMGSTYDPTPQFRAAAVAHFFSEQGLTPDVLRNQYLTQNSLLRDGFRQLDLDPAQIRIQHDVPVEKTGGFTAFLSPRAGDLCKALKKQGVLTDFRGDVLRFGPAPYITTSQITDALLALKRAASNIF